MCTDSGCTKEQGLPSRYSWAWAAPQAFRYQPSHAGDPGPKDPKAREGHQSWTNSRLGRAPTPPTDEYPYDDNEGFDDDRLFKYDDDPRDD